MLSFIAERILADLRRAWLLLGAIVVSGTVAGAIVAAARPVLQEASATLLVLSADGKPITSNDLRALVDGEVLAAAAASSGLAESALAGRFWIRGRPELDIFELGFADGDAGSATRGADALATALAKRIGELGRLRRDLVLDTDLSIGIREREAAEAALLAHIEQVGGADVAGGLRGKQRAERERLRRALDRAEGRERSRWNLDLRHRVDLAWNSPRAAVIRPAGAAVAIARPTAVRAAVSGGAVALFVSVAGVLLFGAIRRPGSPPAKGALAPDA